MPRSLATQSVEELGGPMSVLVRQKRDHVELDGLLQRLAETEGAGQDAGLAAEHQAVMNSICRLVFPHAFAEESVLWPALRRTLDDGEELTLRIEREHQQINELMSRLDRMPVDHPDRRALLEQTVVMLREDVRDEEDLLLPRLQEKASPGELRRLGLAWEAVRRIAPTRPHPVVARRPPGNVLAAAPLSLLDRTRDRLDAVGRRRSGLAGAARVASRGLGAVSGRVEQLPPLRRGERPETSLPTARA